MRRFIVLFLAIFIVFSFITFDIFGDTNNIKWEWIFGGERKDIGVDILHSGNNRYVIAGWSTTPRVLANMHGRKRFDTEMWVLEIEKGGKILWERKYGGGAQDTAKDFCKIEDGYLLLGWTESSDNGIYNHSDPYWGGDIWLLKLDPKGNIIWQRTYGGFWEDVPSTILKNKDGGCILLGSTASSDGDIKENHNSGTFDIWLLKLDLKGNIIWQKTYGGTDDEFADSIIETRDGGYIIIGTTNSCDGDVKKHYGDDDIWIVKIDQSGKILWSRTYGGSGEDGITTILPTADDSYILLANTTSSDHDVYENHGKSDVWIVELTFDK